MLLCSVMSREVKEWWCPRYTMREELSREKWVIKYRRRLMGLEEKFEQVWENKAVQV